MNMVREQIKNFVIDQLKQLKTKPEYQCVEVDIKIVVELIEKDQLALAGWYMREASLTMRRHLPKSNPDAKWLEKFLRGLADDLC